MIGHARMVNGHYYFDDNYFNNKQAQGLSSNVAIFVREKIMLWHLRLGHPSVLYLRHLFHVLFKGLDCSSFQCESYHLSKSHRISYNSKSYHASKPFYLILSDVRDTSKLLS